MQLPIEIVENTSPPQFRWKQKVNTFYGEQEIVHMSGVSVSLESALISLINLAKNQLKEIEEYKKISNNAKNT